MICTSFAASLLAICSVLLLAPLALAQELIPGEMIVHFKEGQLIVPRGCATVIPDKEKGWKEPSIAFTPLAEYLGWDKIHDKKVFISDELSAWLSQIVADRILMLGSGYSEAEENKYGIDWHNRAMVTYEPRLGLMDVGAMGRSVLSSYYQNAQGSFFIGPPNDFWYGQHSQWNLDTVLATNAWIITKGEGVVLGVVDNGVITTGISGNETADISNMVVSGSSTQHEFLWSATNVAWQNHGTFVASVAAAATNNGPDYGSGIAGATWGGRIYAAYTPGQYHVENPGPDVARTVAGINGCITYHNSTSTLRVINLSLGYPFDPGQDMLNAIRTADAEDILIVCAAGNQDQNHVPPFALWPAQWSSSEDNVVAVGAVSTQPPGPPVPITRASFSNYGSWLDLVAPGSFINAIGIDSIADTHVLDADLRVSSGTSFSTPLVAGISTLMFRVNPSMTASQAKDILQSTAREVGNYQYVDHFNVEMGHGMLDAGAAVRQATALNDFVAPNISWFEPNEGATFPHGTIAIRIAASDDRASDQEGRGIAEIRAIIDDDFELIVEQYPVLVGTWTPGPIYAGQHTVRAEVRDYAGNLTTQTHTFTMTTNNAPILLVDPGELTLYVEEVGSASGVVSITNGGDQTLNWYVDENNAEISASPTTGATTTETDHVTFTFTNNENFPSGTDFTYSDVWIRSNGGDARIPITIHVIGNSLPDLRSGSVTPSSGESNELFRFRVEYRDLDNTPPVQTDLVIDGDLRYEMSTNATNWDTYVEYFFEDYLAPGNHYWHCEFRDNAGATARYPSSGERNGPNVTPVQPEIHVTNPPPEGATADQDFSIGWTATGVGVISLYWDSNIDPASGLNPIAANVPNTGSYLWNTAPIPNGTYWIYGVANNQGMVDTDYCNGPLIINHNQIEPVLDLSPPVTISTSNAVLMAVGPNGLVGAAIQRGDSLYFRRSTNNGFSWEDSVLIVAGGARWLWGDGDLVIDSSGTVVIYYVRAASGSYEASYIRSTDGGVSWQPQQYLRSPDGQYTGYVTSHVYGTRIHVAYIENPNWLMKYCYSDNHGASWSTPIQITTTSDRDDSMDQLNYDIFADATGVYIVWDGVDVNYDNRLYMRRSSNGGGSWAARIQIPAFDSQHCNPHWAYDGSMHYVTYDWGSNIYVQKSSNNGTSWLSPIAVPAPESCVYKLLRNVDRMTLPLVRQESLVFRESTDQCASWSDSATAFNGISWNNLDAWLSNGVMHLMTFTDATKYWRTAVPNTAPILTITQPGPGTSLADSISPIAWHTFDPDSNSQTILADLYYDTDQDPQSSIPIQTGQPRSGSFNWNVANVLAGNYYIMGRVNDGAGGLASDYSEGMFRVNHRPSVAIVQPTDPDTVNGSVLVQWTANDPDAGDTATVTLFYSQTADTLNRVLLEDSLSSAGSYLLSVCDLPQGMPLWILAETTDSITTPSWDISDGSLLVDCVGPWFGNGNFSVLTVVPGETSDLSFTINCGDSLSALVSGQPVFMYKRGDADAGFSSPQPMASLTPSQFTCTIPAMGDWSSIMGQEILVRVRAEDAAGNITQPGDFTVTVSIVAVPDPIDDLVIQVANNHQDIELHWSPANGASSYIVYADSVADFVPSPATLLGTAQDTTFTDASAIAAHGGRFYAVTSSASGSAPIGMVLVPAGEFAMGSSLIGGSAIPEHQVNLDAYYIDIYEVTNAQYKAFCDAQTPPRDYPPPLLPAFGGISDYFTNPVYANYPVVMVSWNDARDYAVWAEKRLPTEAEWERAAKDVASNSRYPWGDNWVRAYTNISGAGDNFAYTAPIDSFPEGASNVGCFNMAGNVWEWCEDDWHNSYVDAPSDGSAWIDSPRGARRVTRGGSWPSPQGETQCAWRGYYYPTDRFSTVGFRCVKTP